MDSPTPISIKVHSEGDTAIAAVVIRCGCGDPDGIHPGRICPNPRAVEDKGMIAYNSHNPMRQRIWEIRQAYRRRFHHG